MAVVQYTPEGGENMELKDEILRYRAKHNLSLRDMAKECGISTQTLCSVENGIQNPSKLTEGKIRILLEQDGKNN